MTVPENNNAERRRIQKGRNIALGLLLLGFVVLFYFLTFVKMAPQANAG
ncbi:hypothetical protein [Novosphingobium sp.]|nr:hypothetical protein [Novosphingobium sp.]MDP3908130.1 hypothetical protein [Novosphingobium sp.]